MELLQQSIARANALNGGPLALKAEIGALRTKISQLEATISSQHRSIEEKDERIGDLTRRVGLLAAAVKEKGSVMEGLSKPPRIADVILATCEFFGYSEQDIRGGSRAGKYVHARHIAFYLCRRLTLNSYPKIARAFADRDHTTVMHGHDKIAKFLETDEDAVETKGTPMAAAKSIQFVCAVKSAKRAVQAIVAALIEKEAMQPGAVDAN